MLSRFRQLASALAVNSVKFSYSPVQCARPFERFVTTEAKDTGKIDKEIKHSFGATKIAKAKRAGEVLQLEGVVHILNTSNNIVLTLTDKEGRVKAWTTPSSVGYKNAKKRLPVAAETAAGELAKRALALGYSTVAVKIKGIGTMTQYAVQMLSSSGIKITQLVDVTPVPYNGCRPSRKRRV